LAQSVRHGTEFHAAFDIFTFSFSTILSIFLIMARGKELSPQMRSRICELRSLGWSYNRIHEKHPDIPRTTIANTCRQESTRLENFSRPRPGPPRIISEEQRDLLYDTAISTPAISYEALQEQVAPDASIRSIRRLLQEMNLRK